MATDLSPEQVKAYRIADNKTGELAEWDFDQLRIEFGDLQSANFDLGGLAFDQDKLTRLLEGEHVLDLFGGSGSTLIGRDHPPTQTGPLGRPTWRQRQEMAVSSASTSR